MFFMNGNNRLVSPVPVASTFPVISPVPFVFLLFSFFSFLFFGHLFFCYPSFSNGLASLYPAGPEKRIEILGDMLGINKSEEPVFKEIRVYFKDLKKIGLDPIKITDIAAAGDFNSWKNIHKFKKNNSTPQNEGYYYLGLNLKPANYAYKLVIDNKWIKNPSALHEKPDGFGGTNSVLKYIHNSENRILPFSKKAFTVNDKLYYIFQFSMDNSAVKSAALVNNRPLRSYIDTMPGLTVLSVILEQADFISGRALLSVSALSARDLENNVFPAPFDAWVYTDEKDYSNTGIIYFAMTDRFASASDKLTYDSTNDLCSFLGGNFKGLIEWARKGYFKNLNVRYLWISPVYNNAAGKFRDSLPPHRYFEAYHGYWPVSLNSCDSRFGSLNRLRHLKKVLSQQDSGLMLDMVFNHLHQDSSLYRHNPGWFVPLKLDDGSKNIRKFDSHPITTWFDDFLPSFDYSSFQARRRLIDNAKWWASVTGCSGFRLDAVKHISNDFFADFKQAFSGPDFFTVGETIDSRETISKYLKPGFMKAQFDFPLYFAIRDVFAKKEKPLSHLSEALASSEQAFHGLTAVSTLLGNHDFPRFMAWADNEFEKNENTKETAFKREIKVDNPDNYNKLRAAFTFLMTIKGHPLIYYGDEFGLTGGGDPDNRRPMKFDNDLDKFQASLLSDVQKLTNIRRQYPAFSQGSRVPLCSQKNITAYACVWFDQVCITLIADKGPINDKGPITDKDSIINKDSVSKDIYLKVPDNLAMPFNERNLNLQVLFGDYEVNWHKQQDSGPVVSLDNAAFSGRVLKFSVPDNPDNPDNHENQENPENSGFAVSIVRLFFLDRP
jgi:glycosidase